jgi:hypothetical protein
LWHAEIDSTKERYSQILELRGINEGQEVPQIFADTSELKQGESREVYADVGYSAWGEIEEMGSIVGNPGNGIPCNERDRRRCADPPKNESGTTDTVSSYDRSAKSIDSRNGFYIFCPKFLRDRV